MRRARRIREQAQLTLADVMRSTTLDVGNLSRFERGERGMSVAALAELVQFYASRGIVTTIDEMILDDDTSDAESA